MIGNMGELMKFLAVLVALAFFVSLTNEAFFVEQSVTRTVRACTALLMFSMIFIHQPKGGK